MSLRDDFLEALNSVKRDFFHNPDHSEPMAKPNAAAAPQVPTDSARPAVPAESQAPSAPKRPTSEDGMFTSPFLEKVEVSSPKGDIPDEVVYEAFKQASAIDEDDLHTNTTPYRDFDPILPLSANGGGNDSGDGRKIFDFDEGDIYSDDKTVISKNTIIRGALQTEDSLRLLGQILGDIECKSNVVLAGKVRGNTTAANAYIFDAQVDGDVRCDDIVNISSDAWILGNIRAQQAEVDGKIKGNIEVRHMISIGSTSSILGDISTDELEIKRGAFINGQIMMYSPARDVIDRFDRFEE